LGHILWEGDHEKLFLFPNGCRLRPESEEDLIVKSMSSASVRTPVNECVGTITFFGVTISPFDRNGTFTQLCLVCRLLDLDASTCSRELRSGLSENNLLTSVHDIYVSKPSTTN
jgi:hypothetical protein